MDVGRTVKKKLSSARIIILGFAAAILAGSLLLMLPVSSREAGGTGFMDALFTAASAVCVTGLVVRDTAAYWSVFGQAVILALIQVGGMGVVTMAVTVYMVSGKQITLKQRSTLQESISAPGVGGIVKLTSFILRVTLCAEFLGAVLLAPFFCGEFGVPLGLWYALFHAVSAFCNAGFDLMGIQGEFSSLTGFAGNPAVNLVIMALIIMGGIGFLTWQDIRKNHLHFRRYRMQSKVVLVTSAVLIVLPALYLFFFEFGDLSPGNRVLGSLFQSVTLRTAGFNTLDLTKVSEGGLMIMIILMLVGGSPGSTAGGMKTTTFAVMFSTAISVFSRREHTNFFGRRVEESVIRNAATIVTLYTTLFLTGGILISRLEGLPLMTCLFETASAVGTVGLTLGITPQLGMISRWILIFLMYTGRVGGLTLIFSALSGRRGDTARLPQERLTVG